MGVCVCGKVFGNETGMVHFKAREMVLTETEIVN